MTSHQSLHADHILALFVLVDFQDLQAPLACAGHHVPGLDVCAGLADRPPVELDVAPLDQV